MAKGKILTEQEIKEIIDEYKNTSHGIEVIALKFKTGKLKIKEILLNNNVPFKIKGNNNVGSTKSVDDNLNYKKELLPSEGKEYRAICKKTGKEYKDYLNQSGALSEHILKEFNIKSPNNFFKKKYFLENGKYWHEEYFTLVEVEIKEKRKCKYCDWGTYDIENKTGCYENHLLKEHNINLKTYLTDYPDDLKYHNIHILKNNEEEYLKNLNNSVTCEICGKKLRFINNKHLKILIVIPLLIQQKNIQKKLGLNI